MENNNKHKYSTILLIVVGVLLFIGAIGAFDTGDMEILCSTDNSLIKRISGFWVCSNTNYAESYFYGIGTPATVTVTNSGTYYPIVCFNNFTLNGISRDGDYIKINKNGNYLFNINGVFAGGENDRYEFKLFVNGNGDDGCTYIDMEQQAEVIIYRTLHISCIADLEKDDLLLLKVTNHDADNEDISMEYINFNIVEVV